MSHVIPGLLPRASDNCVDCSGQQTPVCNCAADQDCYQINRDCYTCATIRCVPKGGSNYASTSGSGGVSKGALAGAIIGVLAFLSIAVGLFFWYRRSPRFARNREAKEVKDKPASAADVLNRPDPTEKSLPSPTVPQPNVRHFPGNSNTTIDLDPESQGSSPGGHIKSRPTSTRSNPFSDGHSIQTAGTEGTNVIPIALVSPDGRNDTRRASDTPSRPARSPELQLNLDHVNISHDNLKPGAGSQRSGVSGMSRNSYMTSASYASDLLNEAPMIVTPTQGAVRRVVGAAKPEMVDARSPPGTAKPVITSPLAATSFGPGDMSRSSANSSDNPFSDAHVSMRTTIGSSSPSPSVTTFGQVSSELPRQSMGSDIDGLPWTRPDIDSRPTSMSTQAGSVIDISSATRVTVGTAASGQSLYRTMVGRLVTPSSAGANSMQDQQRHAAEAYAQASGHDASSFDPSRRTSGTSAISATADSILEAFPFVPPSPISNRPARTPPVSPLAQQNFSVTPASPASQSFAYQQKTAGALDSDLPSPPDRRTLGMSTGSQLSTASTGLGSFPFQLEGEGMEHAAPPTSFKGGPKQRASLDTLAITNDLSSYPLGFDKDRKD